MRYEKGTIEISRERDWPILVQTFRSGYVTADQLFELANDEHSSRAAFRTRVTRLLQHGFLKKQTGGGLRAPAYSVTPQCIQWLLVGGECYGGRTGFENDPHACLHALKVTELHLALKRSGQLVRWIPVTEICSRNDLASYRHAKDYDGVAGILAGGKEVRFAIEFERVLKQRSRYEQIRILLESERYVKTVLYVTPHVHIANFVEGLFQPIRKINVAVCLQDEFLRDPLNVSVSLAREGIRVPLRFVLECFGEPAEEDPVCPRAVVLAAD